MVKFISKEARSKIMRAIEEAERLTSGEIRVHFQKKCGPETFLEAKKVFSRLKMHRTRCRNAVLIFVALDSRRFAIVGDQGIHARVGENFWERTRDILASHFSEGKIADGLSAAVQSVGGELKRYFPVEPGDKNELSNTVTGDGS